MVKGLVMMEGANQGSEDLSFVSGSAWKLCLLPQLYVKQGKCIHVTYLTGVL